MGSYVAVTFRGAGSAIGQGGDKNKQPLVVILVVILIGGNGLSVAVALTDHMVESTLYFVSRRFLRGPGPPPRRAQRFNPPTTALQLLRVLATLLQADSTCSNHPSSFALKEMRQLCSPNIYVYRRLVSGSTPKIYR
jgi:hypothetical protein